ncbi:hypothetical protein DFP72DRAFT_43407 [Ephemerocybe angulata]|uniref:Uncharacterized protein n=1 Tax=Ephemerocybe angulata TaxID=980116 RepID=A0A8H6LYF4_9AGAR|nr:hypothetical protein DFP72DRAFT_43407 [Tulosesus angulatus]
MREGRLSGAEGTKTRPHTRRRDERIDGENQTRRRPRTRTPLVCARVKNLGQTPIARFRAKEAKDATTTHRTAHEHPRFHSRRQQPNDGHHAQANTWQNTRSTKPAMTLASRRPSAPAKRAKWKAAGRFCQRPATNTRRHSTYLANRGRRAAGGRCWVPVCETPTPRLRKPSARQPSNR